MTKKNIIIKTPRARLISYWTTTIILVLAILSGGIAQVTKRPQTINGLMKLGYPLYFITLLGLWKILGSITILVPRFPRLKEWAYAGIFFEMTGAAISHVASGSAVWHVFVTSIFALLAIVSWALRPESRILGNLFPPKV